MADSKISALTAVTTPATATELAVNEAGTSKKLTLALLAPFVLQNGLYAPGSFTTPTGAFAVQISRLTLTGTQRATLQGTARIRID